ncbi:MAG TPA: type II toxin-antitoxin system VapC family toxin, partial [Nitrososphaerales archaeon]|nr:type II toxin-antitoxin system VapC family toxin [Nitrososphaerales archaeon]
MKIEDPAVRDSYQPRRLSRRKGEAAMRVYLDSSAIVKRYVKEQGSDSVDKLYHALEKVSETDSAIFFSSWNIGEAFGAIDSKGQREDIGRAAIAEALLLLSLETKKFVAMRRIRIVPIGAKVLTNSRELILKHHIYQADALQIES